MKPTPRHIFLTLFFILFLWIYPYAQPIKLLSWNLKDLGKSKSTEEITMIKDIVSGYDIVIIQEVVAIDPGGAQAIAKIGELLKMSGSNWDYRISDPTSGSSSHKKERYAYLWKPSKVKLIGRPWLEIKYKDSIEREPFFATFSVHNKEFTLVNFHAVTKTAQPEREVKFFKFFQQEYPNKTLIFCGDFNLPQSHTVFNPIKSAGYLAALSNQKTSLKKDCIRDECLASEFDNFFYPEIHIKKVDAGIIPFYIKLPNMKVANSLSDHVPVVFEFTLI